MLNKLYAVSPDTPAPAPSDPAPSTPKSSKRFRKKPLIVMAAVVAVAIILIALVATPGVSAIPLNVEFVVGEKMVYTTDMSLSMNLGNSSLFNIGSVSSSNSLSISGKKTVEVLDFDGQLYTLNSTSTLQSNGNSASFSVIEKMNKTGYTTSIINLGSASMELTSENSFTNYEYLTQLLNQPQVKVGDSITIPYPLPSNLSSNIQVSGDLVLTFKGFQDLTVPAGTFKVFEVDLTSRNLSMTVQIPSNSENGTFSIMPSSMTMGIDLNYKMYFEYNTMREIQSDMQATLSLQTSIINYSMTLGMDMTLNQDIKPS
jgi:hypothetical protein